MDSSLTDSCGESLYNSDSTASPEGPATPLQFPFSDEQLYPDDSPVVIDHGGIQEGDDFLQQEHDDFELEAEIHSRHTKEALVDAPMDDVALAFYGNLAARIQNQTDPVESQRIRADHIDYVAEKYRRGYPIINGTSYSEVVNTKKKPKNGISRPVNAYMFFAQLERRALMQGSEAVQRCLELEEDRQREEQGLAPQRRKQPHSTLHNAIVSKHLGRVWKTLPEYISDRYKGSAMVLKKLHMEQYPWYKYRPKKNGKKSAEATGDAATVLTKTDKPKPRQRRSRVKSPSAAVAAPAEDAAPAPAALPFPSTYLVDRPSEMPTIAVSAVQPSTPSTAVKEEPITHQAEQYLAFPIAGEEHVLDSAFDPISHPPTTDMGLSSGHFLDLDLTNIPWTSTPDYLHMDTRNDSLLQGSELKDALDSGPDLMNYHEAMDCDLSGPDLINYQEAPDPGF